MYCISRYLMEDDCVWEGILFNSYCLWWVKCLNRVVGNFDKFINIVYILNYNRLLIYVNFYEIF